MKRRLSTSAVDEMVRRYEAGEGSLAIAKDHNVSPSALIRVLRSRGVAIREQALSEKVVSEGAALYESGLTLRAVADRLHVSKTTLQRALATRGVSLRPRHTAFHGVNLQEQAQCRYPTSPQCLQQSLISPQTRPVLVPAAGVHRSFAIVHVR